jgi:hypothetical protein
MDVLVPESRRSLAKNQPRFSKTDLESCAAVIEDEGDKAVRGFEAFRACGEFGGVTLSPAAGSSGRFARCEPGRAP